MRRLRRSHMSGRLSLSMLLSTESPRNSTCGPSRMGQILPGVCPGVWMMRIPPSIGITSPSSTVVSTKVSWNSLRTLVRPTPLCAQRYQMGGASPSSPFMSSSLPSGPVSVSFLWATTSASVKSWSSAALPEWSKWKWVTRIQRRSLGLRPILFIYETMASPFPEIPVSTTAICSSTSSTALLPVTFSMRWTPGEISMLKRSFLQGLSSSAGICTTRPVAEDSRTASSTCWHR